MATMINFSSAESESPNCCCGRLGGLRFSRRSRLSSSEDNVVFVNAVAADEGSDFSDDSEDEDEMKSLIDKEVGRVAGWCASFDKVLADSLGVQCFIVFLEREHSEENILFWKEVQEFRKITNSTDLKTTAESIYSRFMRQSAPQQINVDSWVLKNVEENLSNPNLQMFDTAQKEIYQLMKLDSYFRFVRSQLIKDCICAEIAGKPLPIKTPS